MLTYNRHCEVTCKRNVFTMAVSGFPATHWRRNRWCLRSSLQLPLAAVQARVANRRSVGNPNGVLREYVFGSQTIQADAGPKDGRYCHRNIRIIYRIRWDVLR